MVLVQFLDEAASSFTSSIGTTFFLLQSFTHTIVHFSFMFTFLKCFIKLRARVILILS